MPFGDVARLLLLAGLWGGSFAFIRVAAPALGALWLAFARVALAFAALFVLALARRAVPPFLAHWRAYAVIGVVNSALPFALFSFAEQYIGASTAAILNATSPFFGAIVAAMWLKDALTLSKLAGMGLGLAGVVLLVGWQAEPLTGTMLVASLACLAAAISPYERVVPGGIACSAFHTARWNGEPASATGVAKVRLRPAKYAESSSPICAR